LLATVLFLTGSLSIGQLSSASFPQQLTGAMLYTAAKEYQPLAWLHGGERFPIGATIMFRSGRTVRKLVPSFAATADANVSFDGKYVLFSGKPKVSDHWQIWQMDLSTDKLQRVVANSGDAVRPIYLPENRIVYAQKRDGRFVMEAVSLVSGASVLLYYAPGSALPTDVLHDGRILFEAAFPLGSSLSQPEIYTVYSDGSGIESYRCDHGTARYAGKQLVSGDIVFTHGNALGRFTSPLAHEVELKAPVGEYLGDVVEGAAGEWIIPFRRRATQAFSLVSWTPGETAIRTLAKQPGFNLVQPVLVAIRAIPNRHPSGLHEWKTANLVALNSHTSREGSIEADIATVRLYTLNAHNNIVVLGTAPVEKDGSFYVKVPGNRPLKFELLDPTGKILKHETGWMWVRAGEQRICVGCHAGPEHAPENAVPQVLLRSTKPVDLTESDRQSQKGGQ
jgi:hypothetical protein